MACTIFPSLYIMVYNIEWARDAQCLGLDTNLFFEEYEESPSLAASVDWLCSICPIQRECLAVGVSRKEWGVWGGIYLEDGSISDTFNEHKTKEDWSNLWLNITTQRL
jgi:hypothetical protein